MSPPSLPLVTPSPTPDPLPPGGSDSPAPPPDSEHDHSEANQQSDVNKDPDSKPAYQRTRNGKVARLPRQIREQINLMLDDGLTYGEVRRSIGPAGEDLTDKCIGSWRAGGYQDHVHEQQLIQECRFRSELTFNLARENLGIDNFQAAHKLAAALICEAVADLGANTLREALKANPLNLLRMLNSLSRLTSGGLKCERHLADEAERRARLENEKKPAGKKGISPETLTEMKDKLNLM